MELRPSLQDFEEARGSIKGLVHRTPLFSSRSLGERTGLRAWLKAENIQKTGSFKPRGVFNKVLHLPESERQRGIITASAGNCGQAVAYVAAQQGIPGYVVMPAAANQSKVSAVKDYGSHAVLHGELWDDAYAHSVEMAEEKNLTYVHPFKDRFFMAGNGTMAFEILEDAPDVEAVLIPIGGGGLFAGVSLALRQLKSHVRIIGVEPTGSANMFTSRREGKTTDLDAVTTIADGLATKNTDPDVFEIINGVADDLVVVTDEEMLAAIRFLLERAKLLAEPGGAATVAALLSGRAKLPPQTKTVAVISGGNFDVQSRLRLGY
jgi:threonine dehydratase